MPKNQKGFAHFFMLILLIAGIGIGIYLVQHPAIFKPHADSDPNCKASDAYSFFLCVQRANDPADNLNRIEITKQIECTKLQDCAFHIRRGKNLTITGKQNTVAGFKRTVNYNYPLLIIGDLDNPGAVSGLTLENLIFDDTDALCDETNPENCNSPLVLWKVHNSTVDRITILHAKNNGIQIANVFNLTIKNSIIYDSNTNGIWFDDARSCGDVLRCGADPSKISSVVNIENNLIANSRVAAMEFYSYGQPAYHSSIRGNLFVHNHRDAKFIYCPKPDINATGSHCPGGQLAIGKSQYLDIENNIIRDGRIETQKPNDPYAPFPGQAGAGRYYEDMGLHTSGLELSSHLQNVVFTKNKIYNNTGAGIFADYTYFNLAEAGIPNNVGSEGVVQLTYNSVFNNQLNYGRAGVTNLDNVPGIYLKDNTAANNLNIPKAFIFADPPICDVVDSTHCRTTIRWYSEDHPNITTIVSGINTNPNHFADGAQKPDWIPADGINFELVEGNQVLASTFVRGANQPPSNSNTDSNKSASTDTTTNATPAPPSPNSNQPEATSKIIDGENPAPSSSVMDKSQSLITADPNPCTISGGMCTSNIKLNAQGYENLQILIREANNATFTALGADPNGTFPAPWIYTTPITFDLYSNGIKIDSVIVRGQP